MLTKVHSCAVLFDLLADRFAVGTSISFKTVAIPLAVSTDIRRFCVIVSTFFFVEIRRKSHGLRNEGRRWARIEVKQTRTRFFTILMKTKMAKLFLYFSQFFPVLSRAGSKQTILTNTFFLKINRHLKNTWVYFFGLPTFCNNWYSYFT